MADVWQDHQWRENQRKLLTAQFGPKEVETLSMNEVLVIDSGKTKGKTAPLEWMQSKELNELQVGLSCMQSKENIFYENISTLLRACTPFWHSLPMLKEKLASSEYSSDCDAYTRSLMKQKFKLMLTCNCRCWGTRALILHGTSLREHTLLISMQTWQSLSHRQSWMPDRATRVFKTNQAACSHVSLGHQDFSLSMWIMCLCRWNHGHWIQDCWERTPWSIPCCATILLKHSQRLIR